MYDNLYLHGFEDSEAVSKKETHGSVCTMLFACKRVHVQCLVALYMYQSTHTYIHKASWRYVASRYSCAERMVEQDLCALWVCVSDTCSFSPWNAFSLPWRLCVMRDLGEGCKQQLVIPCHWTATHYTACLCVTEWIFKVIIHIVPSNHVSLCIFSNSMLI